MVKNRYDEVFSVEMEGWCYGLETYPGEVYPELVHRIIKELKESLERAIQHNVVFDIVDLSARFSKASKYLVSEKDLVFSLLAQLPLPNQLDEDGMYTLAAVVDKVDKVYEGTLEKLQKRWKKLNEAA